MKRSLPLLLLLAASPAFAGPSTACDRAYASLQASVTKRSKREAQLVRARRLVAVFKALRRRPATRAALARCESNTEGMLRQLATAWHREAVKRNDERLYRAAEESYRLCIDTFPSGPHRYFMTFYYGELLFKRGKWQAAADAYAWVVRSRPNGGKHLLAAAYAHVMAVRKATKSPRPLTISFPKKRPFSKDRAKLLAAYELYIRHVKKSPDLPPILYRAARMYYVHGRLAEAVKRFGRLVDKHPGCSLSQYAANLLLDCLNIQRRYAEMKVWVDRMLASPKIARGQLLPLLKKLKADLARRAAAAAKKPKP